MEYEDFTTTQIPRKSEYEDFTTEQIPRKTEYEDFTTEQIPRKTEYEDFTTKQFLLDTIWNRIRPETSSNHSPQIEQTTVTTSPER